VGDREDSPELKRAIFGGSLEAAVDDISASLLANLLVWKTAYSILEENSIKVQWEGMLGKSDQWIQALEEEVTRLKSASKRTPKPIKTRKIPKERKPKLPAANDSEKSKATGGLHLRYLRRSQGRSL
jgi:hypothetical protein